MMKLDDLKQLVAGDTAAIRGTATLVPAGGSGDKVFPPTHSVGEREPRYAFERRRIDGREVTCVLLDSVQSQANRMEDALQSLWVDKQIGLPVVVVDLTGCAPEVGRVTSLSAPHRIADAILRDSVAGKTLFRHSEYGKSFTDASPRNAGPLFKVCPTGLLFGLWDSTGPKGGLGSKFARAIVSEIVGVDAVAGTKTSSRLDPTGIVTRAAEVYVAAEPSEGWTHDPALAAKESKKDGKPLKFGDGKVSEVNHSNVPPTIDALAGGVTIDHAVHTVVLSLAGLRKLSFSHGDTEARTVLAALGLLATLASESRGYDLRSRCLLVPRAGNALKLESVGRDGTTNAIQLDLGGALALYRDAAASLPKELAFESKPGEPLVTLTPSAKLAHLIKKSRELAAAGEDLEET